MGRGLDESPGAFARRLAREAGGRGLIVSEPETGALRISHPLLEGLAHALRQRPLGWADHEAVLLAAGPETGALFGAFVHSSVRGPAQGGVRRWCYPALEEFLRDGLRLAHGMSRKNALAGLWWGGGKGVIACERDAVERDPGLRRTLYQEYGAFVAGLGGAFVAAEDVGTRPEDVAVVFSILIQGLTTGPLIAALGMAGDEADDHRDHGWDGDDGFDEGDAYDDDDGDDDAEEDWDELPTAI